MLEKSRGARGLPLYSSKDHPHNSHWSFARLPRRFTNLKNAIAGLVGLFLFIYYIFIPWATGSRLPPLYSEYHTRDLQLPQHNPNLSYPEGKDGRYIWIGNQCDGVGWGNYMQEFMLDAFVAYEAGWTNVFFNYTWNKQGGPYTKYGKGLIPSRIPLSALVQGPLVGDPWAEGDDTPRAVVKEFFDQICPKSETIKINPREVDENQPGNFPASVLVDKWIQKLATVQSRCVEVDKDELQIFSFWTFGKADVLLDVWARYSRSPIITQFRWSDLIESAFTTNRHLFTEAHTPVYPYETIPGLLALHIRRGDYEEHCQKLATYGSVFNGFNSFPQFEDKFKVPVTDNESFKKNVYLKACFPSIRQIVEKVNQVKRTDEGKGLKDIFIMTNGRTDWVDELKTELRAAGKWGLIASSRDLTLNWEQKYIAQSVDMLIGQRAQVLVGNGFSSLTSNVVMFRMARDVPPNSNRFW